MKNLAFICCLLLPSVSWGETLQSTKNESERKKIYEIVSKGKIITEFRDNGDGIFSFHFVFDYKKDLWICGFSDTPRGSLQMYVKCVSMKNDN